MRGGNLGEKRYSLFLSLLVLILAMVFLIAFDLIQYQSPDKQDQITGKITTSEFSFNAVEVSESTLIDLRNVSIVLISFITMYVISLKGRRNERR